MSHDTATAVIDKDAEKVASDSLSDGDSEAGAAAPTSSEFITLTGTISSTPLRERENKSVTQFSKTGISSEDKKAIEMYERGEISGSMLDKMLYGTPWRKDDDD